MITFQLNGRIVSVYSPEDAPLLWVIRHELGLTETKFGCGLDSAAPARFMSRGAPREPVSLRSAQSREPR